ncbi:MAG: DUF4055 domain-containing protein [Pseudomonadota bacterium]
MGLSETHPQYDKMIDIWTVARDFYEGEHAVKAAGAKYLPPTSGQRNDGAGKSATSDGALDYEAYKMRALVPDNLYEAIDSAIGSLTKKDPEIILPPAMKTLEERASALGESLPMLLKRIYTDQLLLGRISVLGDLDATNNHSPILTTYDALSAHNWNDTITPQKTDNLSFVALNESCPVMDPESLSWKEQEQYRGLMLLDADGKFAATGGQYATVTSIGNNTSWSDPVFPERMGRRLDQIPFEFINAADLVPMPSRPPMYGLMMIIWHIYMGEADYRQHVHTQGQDTLFTNGFDLPKDDDGNPVSIRTGAGTHIHAPSDKANMKYVGVDSSGLEESRTMLENDYTRASQKGGQLLDRAGGNGESGEALRIRIASQTIRLPNIAIAGAAGVQSVLRKMAPLYGVTDLESIQINPNLKFVEDEIDMSRLVDAMEAKTLGFPISRRSLHTYAFKHGYTEKTYEQEIDEIAEEEADMPPVDDDDQSGDSVGAESNAA